MPFDEYKIIVLICEDEIRKQQLISLFSGRGDVPGICKLDNISTNENCISYKRKVDFIDPKEIDSELTVKEYLIFYTMVSGYYHEGTLEELAKVFLDLHKQEIMSKKVNELARQDQVLVRCITSLFKNLSLLVSKDLLDGQLDDNIEILEFLEKYFVKKSCYCILFEDSIESTENVSVEVIRI